MYRIQLHDAHGGTLSKASRSEVWMNICRDLDTGFIDFNRFSDEQQKIIYTYELKCLVLDRHSSYTGVCRYFNSATLDGVLNAAIREGCYLIRYIKIEKSGRFAVYAIPFPDFHQTIRRIKIERLCS